MNPKGTRKNLKPFSPGVSGNPGGRPKKRPVSNRYIYFLEQPLRDSVPEERAVRIKLGLAPGATCGDAAAVMQIRRAISGKTEAVREIREAIEGKAPQRIELTGEEDGQVDLTISVDQSIENLMQLTEELRARITERQRRKQSREAQVQNPDSVNVPATNLH
jgi:hypothetical protein